MNRPGRLSLLALLFIGAAAVTPRSAHAQGYWVPAGPMPARYSMVGPYLQPDVGFHDPIGSDYSSNLDGGFGGRVTAGWRFMPEFSLEASIADAGVVNSNSNNNNYGNTGDIGAFSIDARIYPWIYAGHRYYRRVVEPDILIGVDPVAHFNSPDGHTFDGYGANVGAGLRFWPAGQLIFLTTDVRYSFLRFTREDGNAISPTFNGDDLMFTVGLGLQIPIFEGRGW